MRTLILASVLLGLGACSSAQLQTAASTPTGQLFCAVQTNGGGALVVAAIDAQASALAPAAAPVAVIATGATKAFVDSVCAKAGGIPVSPPANPAAAPSVAVVVPPAAS
jgi:hypothetical protein